MEFTDPFSFRRLFNLSMSYGGVVFLILCLGPLKPLLEAPITPELLREAAGGIGALLPVGMGISAVVAGVVRKLLFRYGGVNKASLWAIFLVGSFDLIVQSHHPCCQGSHLLLHLTLLGKLKTLDAGKIFAGLLQLGIGFLGGVYFFDHSCVALLLQLCQQCFLRLVHGDPPNMG